MAIEKPEFSDRDIVIEVMHHETLRYCEHPDQNYLIKVYEKGVWRGNAGGHEHAWQALEAATNLRKGLEMGFRLATGLDRGRQVYIVETEDDSPPTRRFIEE